MGSLCRHGYQSPDGDLGPAYRSRGGQYVSVQLACACAVLQPAECARPGRPGCDHCGGRLCAGIWNGGSCSAGISDGTGSYCCVGLATSASRRCNVGISRSTDFSARSDRDSDTRFQVVVLGSRHIDCLRTATFSGNKLSRLSVRRALCNARSTAHLFTICATCRALATDCIRI